MSNLIVLVTGSRSVPVTEWDTIVKSALDEQLASDPEHMTIMHGMCPHPGFVDGSWQASIDMLADEWAMEKGVNVVRFPARWNKHGKAAGPIRNHTMVDTYLALTRRGSWRGSILAFHPNLGSSAGTGGLVNYAKMMYAPSIMHYDGQTVRDITPTLIL